MTKNSISNRPHELRRPLDHGRQKLLCRRDVSSPCRGLLFSLEQLPGVLGFHGQLDLPQFCQWHGEKAGVTERDQMGAGVEQ